MERRVKRALVDLEDVLRELLDALGDAPAVHRARGKGLQDQDVEGSLQEIAAFAGHSGLLSLLYKRGIRALL